MNRTLVLAEWQRATQSLHGAKAALFVHDVATTSHTAVRRMFGRHLIRTGERVRLF